MFISWAEETRAYLHTSGSILSIRELLTEYRHGGAASVKDKTLCQLTSQKLLLFLKVGGGLLLGGCAGPAANSVHGEIGLRFLFVFRLKHEVGFELLLTAA